MDGMSEHFGPRKLSTDEIEALFQGFSNENPSAVTFKHLESIAGTIRQYAANMELGNESLAALKARFEACVDELRANLKPASPEQTRITALEGEIEALLNKEYPAGLETPPWEDDRVE